MEPELSLENFSKNLENEFNLTSNLKSNNILLQALF